MEPPTSLFPPPAVWLCPECGDVYEATPADGNCPNPGHAAVKLSFATIRPVRGSTPNAPSPREHHGSVR